MTGARVMHPPDPVAGLIAQYHEAVATINGFPVRDGVNGDAECSRFCDEVFDPLRDRIATTRPTTRAGLFALLDLAVREFGHDQSPMMPALIENARDAVKEAAPGVMVPLVEDPIFGPIKVLEKARAAIAAKKEHIAPLRAKIPADVPDLAEWYGRVGMPFTPATEDAYWEADFEAANNAEAAVIEGEAVTPAGLAAKAACLWWVRSRDEGRPAQPNYLEAVEAHGRLSDEAVLAAFARDAAALFEWPVPCATMGGVS